MNVLLIFITAASIASVLKDFIDTSWGWDSKNLISVIVAASSIAALSINISIFMKCDKNRWKTFILSFYKAILFDYGEEHFIKMSGWNRGLFCNQSSVSPSPFYGGDIMCLSNSDFGPEGLGVVSGSVTGSRKVEIKNTEFPDAFFNLKFNEFCSAIDGGAPFVRHKLAEGGIDFLPGGMVRMMFSTEIGGIGVQVNEKDLLFQVQFVEGRIATWMVTPPEEMRNDFYNEFKQLGNFVDSHEVGKGYSVGAGLDIKIINFYIRSCYFLLIFPFKLVFHIVEASIYLLFTMTGLCKGGPSFLKSILGSFHCGLDEIPKDAPKVKLSPYRLDNNRKSVLSIPNENLGDFFCEFNTDVLDGMRPSYVDYRVQIGEMGVVVSEHFVEVKINEITVWIRRHEMSYKKIAMLRLLLEFWSKNPEKGIIDPHSRSKLRKGAVVLHCWSVEDLMDILCNDSFLMLFVLERKKCYCEGSAQEEVMDWVLDAASRVITGQNKDILSGIIDFYSKGLSEEHSSLVKIKAFEGVLKLNSAIEVKRKILETGAVIGNHQLKRMLCDINYMMTLIGYGELRGLDKSVGVSKYSTSLCRGHSRLWDKEVKMQSWDEIFKKMLSLGEVKSFRPVLSSVNPSPKGSKRLENGVLSKGEYCSSYKKEVLLKCSLSKGGTGGVLIKNKPGKDKSKTGSIIQEVKMIKENDKKVKGECSLNYAKALLGSMRSQISGCALENLKRKDDVMKAVGVRIVYKKMSKEIEKLSSPEGSQGKDKVRPTGRDENKSKNRNEQKSHGGIEFYPDFIEYGWGRNRAKKDKGDEEKKNLNRAKSKIKHFTGTKWLCGKLSKNIYDVLENHKSGKLKSKLKEEIKEVLEEESSKNVVVKEMKDSFLKKCKSKKDLGREGKKTKGSKAEYKDENIFFKKEAEIENKKQDTTPDIKSAVKEHDVTGIEDDVIGIGGAGWSFYPPIKDKIEIAMSDWVRDKDSQKTESSGAKNAIGVTKDLSNLGKGEMKRVRREEIKKARKEEKKANKDGRKEERKIERERRNEEEERLILERIKMFGIDFAYDI